MTVSFAPVDLDERELESALMKNPSLMEEGLHALDHQVPTGQGFIDMLCVDKVGSLTVIELKVEEDDVMLVQALDYLDWVTDQIDRLAERYKEKEAGDKIDISKEPRVILVAPSFSTRLRNAVNVTPNTDLFEFECLEVSTGGRGLRLRDVSKEPARSPPRLVTVDDHLGYITNQPAHDLCKEVVQKIKSIDEAGIELKPTQYYLAMQHRGRNIAAVYPKRDFFYLSYPEKGETIYVEVRKSTDVTEEVFSKIKEVYMKLSGRS